MPTEISAHTDVLLIGGGAIGLLSAIRLAESGLRVTVLDQGHIGQEASWAGGGILSPLYPWHYPPALLSLALYSM
ncbi:NAD(P)/FAD-dependent oxidoreductase, partial [Acidithiobacillus ferridurans]